MKKTLATLLFAVSSAACADINLYGPGGPHTALQEAAALYTQKTGVPIKVHYGPQAKWNDEARKNADILFGASGEHKKYWGSVSYAAITGPFPSL